MSTPLERVRNYRPTRMHTIIAGIVAALVVISTGLLIYSNAASASTIRYEGSGILDLDKTLLAAEALHQGSLSEQDRTASAEGEGKSLCFVAVAGEQATNTLACGVVLRNGAVASKYETLPVTWEAADDAEGAFRGTLASDTFTGQDTAPAGTELRRPDGKQAISPDALTPAEVAEIERLEASTDAVLTGATIVEDTAREVSSTVVKTPGSERVVRIGTTERVLTEQGVKAAPDGSRIVYVSSDVVPTTPGAASGSDTGTSEPGTSPSPGESSEGDAGVQQGEPGSSEGDVGVPLPSESKPTEWVVIVDNVRFPVTSADLEAGLPVLIPSDATDVSLVAVTDRVEQEISLVEAPGKPVGSVSSDSPAADSLYKKEGVFIENTSTMHYNASISEGVVDVELSNLTLAEHSAKYGWANGGQHQWVIATLGKVSGYPDANPALALTSKMMSWEHSRARANGIDLGAPRVVNDPYSSAVVLLWAAPLEMTELSIVARPTVTVGGNVIMSDEQFATAFTIPEHIAEPFNFEVTRVADDIEDNGDTDESVEEEAADVLPPGVVEEY